MAATAVPHDPEPITATFMVLKLPDARYPMPDEASPQSPVPGLQPERVELSELRQVAGAKCSGFGKRETRRPVEHKHIGVRSSRPTWLGLERETTTALSHEPVRHVGQSLHDPAWTE